jgi:hypothetical protein
MRDTLEELTPVHLCTCAKPLPRLDLSSKCDTCGKWILSKLTLSEPVPTSWQAQIKTLQDMLAEAYKKIDKLETIIHRIKGIIP